MSIVIADGALNGVVADEPNAAAAAALVVERQMLAAQASTVKGRYPCKPDWQALVRACGSEGLCDFLVTIGLSPANCVAVTATKWKKAFAGLKDIVGAIEGDIPAEVTSLLSEKDAFASFKEFAMGLRTAYPKALEQSSLAALGTVESKRTKAPASAVKIAPDAVSAPAKPAMMRSSSPALGLQGGYAYQLSDMGAQLGGPIDPAQRPPLHMFNIIATYIVCTPPSSGSLREVAADLYVPKQARWSLIRTFVEQAVPALALCCVSTMGTGLLEGFGPGRATDELAGLTAYGDTVRVGLKMTAMFAFQLALRTLAEGGAAGGGLSPASTLATFEQVWLMLNTALADGHGSMSDIFLFVSKNMVAVEAAGDKDKGKGKASEPPKGDGKKPASQPKSRSSPRDHGSVKKSKKEKKSSRKTARRADTSSSESESSSESSESESGHYRDTGSSSRSKPKKGKKSSPRDPRAVADDKKKVAKVKAEAVKLHAKKVKLDKETKVSSKDKKESKKRKRPSTSSSSSSSSDSDSYESDMGGSRTSIMPCYREAYDRGGCDRGDECPFSHRPRLMKAARAKGRGGAKRN